MIELLAGHPTAKDLASFVARLSACLGTAFEERESSNYPEGHYFKADWRFLDIKVYEEDTWGDADWPYTLWVTSWDDPHADRLDWIEALVRECLLPAGFKVARILSPQGHDDARVEY